MLVRGGHIGGNFETNSRRGRFRDAAHIAPRKLHQNPLWFRLGGVDEDTRT